MYFFYNILLIIVFNLLITKSFCQQRIILPEILNENSGMIFKGDTIVWLNDSGNPAELIFTDSKGKLISSIHLPLINNDWEALTKDHTGNIYIADVGNNNYKAENFTIYFLNSSFQLQDSLTFHYPIRSKSINFNCEAMCWFQDSLHLFTKGDLYYSPAETCHFKISLPLSKGKINNKGCTATLHPFIITDAAINPTGDILVILSYRYRMIGGFLPDTDTRLYFFNLNNGIDDLFNQPFHYYTLPTFLVTRQYESVAYDNEGNLWIASEKTAFLKPILKKIKLPAKLQLVRN